MRIFAASASTTFGQPCALQLTPQDVVRFMLCWRARPGRGEASALRLSLVALSGVSHVPERAAPTAF